MLDKIPLQIATATSEDRLFEILSRPSLHEMRAKYQEFFQRPDWTIGDRRQFFLSHGWTLKEFCQKHRELGIQLPHD